MRRTFFILFFALSLFTLISCKKETAPATPTGPIAATISNSESANGTFYFQPTYVKFSGDTFSFFSTSTINSNGNSGEEEIYLRVKTKSPGTFLLSVSNYGANFAGGWGSMVSFSYYTDSIHTGSVTITKLDTVNHIASGTFYFTPEEQTPARNGGTDNVSNGSFTNLTW